MTEYIRDRLHTTLVRRAEERGNLRERHTHTKREGGAVLLGQLCRDRLQVKIQQNREGKGARMSEEMAELV